MELLPDAQTPSWLGLPNNAERVLLTTQGECPSPAPARHQLLRPPRPGRQGAERLPGGSVLDKSHDVYGNQVWKSHLGFHPTEIISFFFFFRIVKCLVLSGILNCYSIKTLFFRKLFFFTCEIVVSKSCNPVLLKVWSAEQ